MNKCLQCGKEFTPNTKKQKYCSITCANKSKRQNVFICKYCGKTYHAKRKDRNTYCSRECAFEYRKVNAIIKVKPKQICVMCGNEFEGRKDSKHCSDECKKNKERKRFYQKYISVKETNPVIIKKCECCEKLFETNFMSNMRKYCSSKCSEKAYEQRDPEKKKMLKRHENRRRNARLKGAKIIPYKDIDIYERDKWKCQLCGKKVNKNNKVPHPMSATIDHIMPLDCGGTDEPKNVQLAHFICNSKKGNRGTDQLRLFG